MHDLRSDGNRRCFSRAVEPSYNEQIRHSVQSLQKVRDKIRNGKIGYIFKNASFGQIFSHRYPPAAIPVTAVINSVTIIESSVSKKISLSSANTGKPCRREIKSQKKHRRGRTEAVFLFVKSLFRGNQVKRIADQIFVIQSRFLFKLFQSDLRAV